MIGLLPDWVVVVATMLAIAVFVTGRIRLAGLLAAPALLRFVLWPAVTALIQDIPPLLLITTIVLALPVIILWAARSFLTFLVGQNATDHAVGHALGTWLVHLFRRPRS